MAIIFIGVQLVNACGNRKVHPRAAEGTRNATRLGLGKAAGTRDQTRKLRPGCINTLRVCGSCSELWLSRGSNELRAVGRPASRRVGPWRPNPALIGTLIPKVRAPIGCTSWSLVPCGGEWQVPSRGTHGGIRRSLLNRYRRRPSCIIFPRQHITHHPIRSIPPSPQHHQHEDAGR
ncbi:hypothetical protein CGRA01v4_04814 [Colletotrichum graminicola]|nr:hypothetical protein CGRA01v4_04814 [Colletotrichum graminicola]